MDPEPEVNFSTSRLRNVAAASVLGLGAATALVALSARRTERKHPPAGRFVNVSGVAVHYLEVGSGPPVVLIHGNMMSSEDFVASGIVERLATRHRVIVFDRPGFGYTDRPPGTGWTPTRQAALLHEALVALEVVDPILVGHSLGSLVTVALAIAYPADARALVLLSGYYFPTNPLGVTSRALPALPGLVDVARFTTAPVMARVMSPVIARTMFSPAPVTPSFAEYPLSMSRRPSQIRATLEDAAFMDPCANELAGRYAELTMPVEILAGDGDKVVNTWQQSQRLGRHVPDANFGIVVGAGHMIHYIAPERVVAAIEKVENRLAGFPRHAVAV